MLRVIVAALLVCGATADVTPCSTNASLVPEYLTVHKVVGDWEEADLQCKSEGAVIASPISTELLNVMKCLIGVNNTPYLIGTRARGDPRSFTSMEGVGVERMGGAVLAMIQQLEPQDGGCLSLDRRSIRVVPCWSRLPFMCYRAQLAPANVTSSSEPPAPAPGTSSRDVTAPANVTSERSPPAAAPAAAPGTSSRDVTAPLTSADVHALVCGTQGYKFNVTLGSCYKLHTERKTWDEAASTCAAERAHLVVLDDEREAQFVTSMVIQRPYPNTHIGIRGEGPNKWTSVTGKSMADLYNQWHSDHPTLSGVACGVIRPSAKMDDFSCIDERTFICEKHPASL